MHFAFIAILLGVGSFFFVAALFARLIYLYASLGLQRFGVRARPVQLAGGAVGCGLVLSVLAIYKAETATLATVDTYNMLSLLGVFVVLSSVVSLFLLLGAPGKRKRRKKKRSDPREVHAFPWQQQLALLGLMLAGASVNGLVAWILLAG